MKEETYKAAPIDEYGDVGKAWLTTKDNPYDPFYDWDNWYNFDERKGYCTCGLIARYAFTSSELSEKQNDDEIDKAIDKIINTIDFMHQYKVVYKKAK